MPPGHLCGWIFAVYGSNGAILDTDGPFGGFDDIRICLGVYIPRKPHKGGVVRKFQTKTP